MRILLPVLFGCGAAFATMGSCANSPASKTEVSQQGTIVYDTLQKKLIDSLVHVTTKEIAAKNIEYRTVPYTKYQITDSIGFWFTDSKMGRISFNMHPDSSTIWPFFWIYNGELIRVRIRQMYYTNHLPAASETMIYLKDGQVVYAEEHHKDLEKGETPGAVLKIPMVESKRSPAELEKEFKEYFELCLDELKKNKVLPNWLKS